MKLDPILAEIRQTRDALALKFKGDIRAIAADMEERRKKSGRPVFSQPAKRIPPEALAVSAPIASPPIPESPPANPCR